MKKLVLYFAFCVSLLFTLFAFLFSCIVTMADGQGALIFAVTIPIMTLLLAIARFSGKILDDTRIPRTNLKKAPIFLLTPIVAFFVFSMIPGLDRLSSGFMGLVSRTFELTTGKSPMSYFKEKKSFPYLLRQQLAESKEGNVNFDVLGVTFAWDKVCVFGPYTKSDQARKILGIDWSLEERSKIATSDSINALVFLYQGKANTVIDLSRTFVDFENPNRCIERAQARFSFYTDENGRTIITLPL